VVQVLAAAVLFGTTGTAQALGPADTTPLGVGAARLLVDGTILLLALPVLGGRLSRALGLWLSPLGLAAGVCTALYQVCFFAAVQQAGVALGTLVTIGSGPVFAGLLALAVLEEILSRPWVVATALCVLGLGLLTATGAAQLTGGAIGWLGQPSGIALAAYLGVLTTGLAYVLFGRGLAVLPAAPVTTLVLAEPVVAALLGVTLLGEQLTPLGLAGSALVLAGLILQGAVAARRPNTVPHHREPGARLRA
jgi:DME family drug/metabolite transporter